MFVKMAEFEQATGTQVNTFLECHRYFRSLEQAISTNMLMAHAGYGTTYDLSGHKRISIQLVNFSLKWQS